MFFIAVDIETTGFSHNYDSIMQIGAVKIVDGKCVGEFNKYIKLTKTIPAELTELTGIDNKLLEEKGEPYARVLKDFVDFIEHYPLFSHNASFDHRFLSTKIKRKLFISLNNPYHCSMQLSRKILKSLPNHRLDTVSSYLGIPNIDHHDALNDARVCADIVIALSGGKPLFYKKAEPTKEGGKSKGLLDTYVDMKQVKQPHWKKL